MKRDYLKVPGQKVVVTLAGPSGCGKTQIIQRLQDTFASEGLLVSGASGGFKGGRYVESFEVECPTTAQAQSMYFATLDEQQRETLRGHLAALGYEL